MCNIDKCLRFFQFSYFSSHSLYIAYCVLKHNNHVFKLEKMTGLSTPSYDDCCLDNRTR